MWSSRALLVLPLVAGCALADLRTNGVALDSIDVWAATGQQWTGDTLQPSAWTGPTNGGLFNGGRVYFPGNDTTTCGAGNISFYELTKLDWSAHGNTSVSCVNTMSSYGAGTNTGAGWTDGVSWKSFNPWALNDEIYLPIFRVVGAGGGPSYFSIVMSPDRGLHWCNPATFASGGNNCSASNWSATGDAPPNPSTGIMWGTSAQNNNYARLMPVQFCQNQNCTGMPFNADNYLYFASTGADYAGVYGLCVAKSRTAIMDATQWWFYKGGNGSCGDPNSWTHSMGSGVAINKMDSGTQYVGFANSVIYVAAAGQFFMTGYAGTSSGTSDSRIPVFAVSDYPWGPWKRVAVPGATMGGFISTSLAFLDGSCAGCGSSPGFWNLGLMTTIYDHHPSGSIALYKIALANGGGATSFTAQRGIGTLGRTSIRTSPSGVGNRVISKGMVYALGMDEWYDFPASDRAGAMPVVNDMLGSKTCLIGGNNQPGFLVWGNTVRTRYTTGGILQDGSEYAPQFATSGNGNPCTGAIPLSGSGPYTIQIIANLSSVSPGGVKNVFYLSDPATGLYQTVHFLLNVAGTGSLDWGENSPLGYNSASASAIAAAGGWSANNWYLLTLSFSGGALNPNSGKLYLGGKQVAMTQVGSADSNSINLPNDLRLRLGCWDSGNNSYCDPGGWQGSNMAASYAYFAVYNRALSADEVAHNYAALKTAMAQQPRGILLQ